MELFADGKIDAFLGFPPEPQELRARKIGHVILNTATDQPWSQYFCCMLSGNRDFVRDHPIATKRVLRAILKAADLCAAEPERVAQRLVDGGFTERYDYALQTLTEVPYDRWREFDPEDTLRFYALRLHEVGMIKSSPNADHRRRHRLALPERAQARAEGVSAPRAGAELNRGGFDADHAESPRFPGQRCRLAGAAGVLGARRSLADEGPPETTTIRLASRSRHLPRAAVRRRGAAARRRLHRRPLRDATERLQPPR